MMDRDELAMKVDVSGYEFPDMRSAAEFVGEEFPVDFFDRIRISAKANAKLRYLLADALIEESKKWES